MTLSEFLAAERLDLRERGRSDLEEEVRIWLSEVLQVNRPFLLARGQDEIRDVCTEAQLRFFDEVRDRRIAYEPLSYILGYAHFYGRCFLVSPGVLTPRGDSECLIERLMSLPIPEEVSPFFLDLCTGSGCLGITALLEWRARGRLARGILTDISETAVGVAAKNCEALACGTQLVVRETDLIPGDLTDACVDIILSNPPYIPAEEIPGLMPEVSGFEPRLALDGGEDGLVFYRRILEEGLPLLRDGGYLLVEHGFDQGTSVPKLFREHGLRDVEMFEDYGGNPRVTIGRKGCAG